MKSVVQNKVACWVPRGLIVVSTNYRLIPGTDPLEQARDVARALAEAQSRSASWGGDRSKCILMGHSAGAHLVALLSAKPSLASGIVSTPWLGTIVLDSAAFDIVKLMERRHTPLYDRAFGRDPDYLKSVSPYHTLTEAVSPMLIICSGRRLDACAQARQFAARALSFGRKVSVLERDLSHREVNLNLGEDKGYTAAVEAFMAGLDESLAKTLRLTFRSPRARAKGIFEPYALVWSSRPGLGGKDVRFEPGL